MFALLHSLAMFGVDLFKPQRRLEVENLFLRVHGEFVNPSKNGAAWAAL